MQKSISRRPVMIPIPRLYRPAMYHLDNCDHHRVADDGDLLFRPSPFLLPPSSLASLAPAAASAHLLQVPIAVQKLKISANRILSLLSFCLPRRRRFTTASLRCLISHCSLHAMWTPQSRSGALNFLKHQVVKLRSATVFDKYIAMACSNLLAARCDIGEL